MKVRSLLSGVAISAAIAAVLAQSASAALSRSQRVADFNQLQTIVERNYGPLQWKKTSIGLDWAKHVENFRAKAEAAPSDTKFYQVLAQFLSGLQDAHVSSSVPSNYKASLGFLCDYIEGKVLIELVDTLRLPEMLFPFKKGDQLLAIGNVPVAKIMEDLSLVNNTGSDASQKRIAAARLTSRPESAGLAVPKGVTTITVLPKGAAQPVTVTATWIVRGVPMVELDDLSNILDGGQLAAVTPSSFHSGFDLKYCLKQLPMFNLSVPQEKIREWMNSGVKDIGSPKSMFTLPTSAKEIEEIPVTAAVYEAAGKKIGLLRINQYDGEELLQNVARAILQMQPEVDVLVLDQTNNPGGRVDLVTSLISMFAKQSATDMMFEIRPSMNWLGRFKEINQQIADMLSADPKDMVANALKARFQYLEDEMTDSIRARKFLTSSLSLDMEGSYGMIQPQPEVRFTKPVLLLINELDFSGGDAFPALMQDNKLAVLFGARTTGAGGNVSEYGPLANSQFKFHLTESLMVRPNGKYVENLGITPDVEYKITEDDFMNGYKSYVKAFTKSALQLVGVTASPADLEKLYEVKKPEPESKEKEAGKENPVKDDGAAPKEAPKGASADEIPTP